jgi:murein endopeptidase
MDVPLGASGGTSGHGGVAKLARSWKGQSNTMCVRFWTPLLCFILALAPRGVTHAQDAGPGGDAGAAPQGGDAAVPAPPADGELEGDEDDDEGEDGEDTPGAPDAESEAELAPGAVADTTLRYSRDISDAQLESLWEKNPAALGTMSVGFADAGRIINARPFPQGPYWTVVAPEQAWAVQETVDGLVAAMTEVNQIFPEGTPLLRVNHISKKEGGYIRPHRSHQSGRDADVAFYYKTEVPPGWRGAREKLMDIPRNWAFIKALLRHSDVQVIIVDKRIQKVLREYALEQGDDPLWLEGLFKPGPTSVIRHARRHRDHFHVRFYAPRSQELGRRVQPLLARRPEENILVHRVRRGDTLGHIAMRYDSTVNMVRRANHMKGSFLRLGQTLLVPLRGPCTRCPQPPAVVVPPRRIRLAGEDGGAAAALSAEGGLDAGALAAQQDAAGVKDAAGCEDAAAGRQLGMTP